MLIACRLFLMILLSVFTLSAARAADDNQNTLLVFGDSLSAAYGMDTRQGWVALLEQRLQQTHPEWKLVNLSLSGETSAGGLRRFPEALERHDPEVILLELGANDGLRGLPVPVMKKNLQKMIQQAEAIDAEVLLFEMQIPPNYGPLYTRLFNNTFHKLADKESTTLVPFFLEDVAGNAKLNQADGIHPLPKAQPVLLDNVWPLVEDALDD
ncbi:arylesterase [Spongorhabdus nitratireducens]